MKKNLIKENIVKILKFTSYENIREKLIKEIKRVLNFIPDTILIKPNFLTSVEAEKGITTDLNLIKAVVETFRHLGVKNIIIGESPAGDSERILKLLGVFKLAKELKVELVMLDKDKQYTAPVPNGKVFTQIVLPEVLKRVDLIVNMPKIKTHAEAGVTLGIKNFFGVYTEGARKAAHRMDLHHAIVEIFSYIYKNFPILTIVDGIVSLSGLAGPIRGTPLKTSLVVLGTDTYYTDYFIVKEIMKYEPHKVPHLFLVREYNLKCDSIKFESEIDLSKLPSFTVPSVLYVKMLNKILSKLKAYFSKNIPYLKNPENCVQCRSCIMVCPVDAITLKEKIEIDYTRCIGCLCCYEACAYSALGFIRKESFIYKIYKKITGS